jgi:hypothetical protein
MQPVAGDLRALANAPQVQRDRFGDVVLILDDEDERSIRGV